jgi:hypothetical protein
MLATTHESSVEEPDAPALGTTGDRHGTAPCVARLPQIGTQAVAPTGANSSERHARSCAGSLSEPRGDRVGRVLGGPRAVLEATISLDTTYVLASIQAPTLILRRR